MDVNEILSRFKNVKRLKKGSWQVRCPCHKDDKASLTITDTGNRILMYCHAGCDIRDIIQAAGLTMTDLGAPDKPKKNSWTEEAEAVYNYGKYVKVRYPGKIIRYGRIINNDFIPGIEDIDKTLYRLPELLNSIREGYPVYYVEGEKDADNLHKLGLTATTAGSCSDWNAGFAHYFKGAKVIILPDNDKPGLELAETIRRDLRDFAFSIRTVITDREDKGDVSDFLDKGGTKEELMNRIAEAVPVYASWVKVKEGKPNGVLTDSLAHTIAKSLDYMVVKKPGLDVAEFYIYGSGVYKRCSKNEAKAIIKEYVPLGYATDTMLNNVYNLILCTRENSYDFSEIDKNERVINVKNGILDLKTKRLEKHTPKLKSTIQLNCNYEPKARCPGWIKYINTLCSDSENNTDTEKVTLLQEWTGLLLSNVAVNRTKKCLVLTSPLGNTGKSVFLRILRDFLGIDNIANIPIQNMSDRFALSDLCGKRLDIVGDQRSDDIADSSVFKQLTGGDAVKIEFKGKQSFSWDFTGGIVMACNTLPAFTDDKGGHIFERLNIIPCERVIPMEERDGAISQKLWKEADGILNWALEGLYRLRNNGFKFSRCKADEDVIDEYRGRLDTLYGFINDNFEITDDKTDRVKKTDFEDLYLKWCKDNELTPLNKRNIKERAAKSGIALVKVQGEYYYKGLKTKWFTEAVSTDMEDIDTEVFGGASVG